MAKIADPPDTWRECEPDGLRDGPEVRPRYGATRAI
jgi:hypothetical protein